MIDHLSDLTKKGYTEYINHLQVHANVHYSSKLHYIYARRLTFTYYKQQMIAANSEHMQTFWKLCKSS